MLDVRQSVSHTGDMGTTKGRAKSAQKRPFIVYTEDGAIIEWWGIYWAASAMEALVALRDADPSRTVGERHSLAWVWLAVAIAEERRLERGIGRPAPAPRERFRAAPVDFHGVSVVIRAPRPLACEVTAAAERLRAALLRAEVRVREVEGEQLSWGWRWMGANPFECSMGDRWVEQLNDLLADELAELGCTPASSSNG